jgi:hypothetical protein
MNVEIGAEAAQFPEKKYINGIAVAVQHTLASQKNGTNLRLYTFVLFLVKNSQR